MATKFDNLLTQALRLSQEDRERLIGLLRDAQIAQANAVRDGAATYNAMKLVTVALPDDLAKQAQEAGLLAQRALEKLLRQALQAHSDAPVPTRPKYRRLIEKDGYLVAEAFPGEKPITTEEVKKILDDMEW